MKAQNERLIASYKASTPSSSNGNKARERNEPGASVQLATVVGNPLLSQAHASSNASAPVAV